VLYLLFAIFAVSDYTVTEAGLAGVTAKADNALQ
jgi:hypothetical protein